MTLQQAHNYRYLLECNQYELYATAANIQQRFEGRKSDRQADQEHLRATKFDYRHPMSMQQ